MRLWPLSVRFFFILDRRQLFGCIFALSFVNVTSYYYSCICFTLLNHHLVVNIFQNYNNNNISSITPHVGFGEAMVYTDLNLWYLFDRNVENYYSCALECVYIHDISRFS